MQNRIVDVSLTPNVLHMPIDSCTHIQIVIDALFAQTPTPGVVPLSIEVERVVSVGIDLLADAPVQAVVFVDLPINIGRAGFDLYQSVPRIVVSHTPDNG